MCQTVKIMDYLESKGVLPRSLGARILHVGRSSSNHNEEILYFT